MALPRMRRLQQNNHPQQQQQRPRERWRFFFIGCETGWIRRQQRSRCRVAQQRPPVARLADLRPRIQPCATLRSRRIHLSCQRATPTRRNHPPRRSRYRRRLCVLNSTFYFIIVRTRIAIVVAPFCSKYCNHRVTWPVSISSRREEEEEECRVCIPPLLSVLRVSTDVDKEDDASLLFVTSWKLFFFFRPLLLTQFVSFGALQQQQLPLQLLLLQEGRTSPCLHNPINIERAAQYILLLLHVLVFLLTKLIQFLFSTAVVAQQKKREEKKKKKKKKKMLLLVHLVLHRVPCVNVSSTRGAVARG